MSSIHDRVIDSNGNSLRRNSDHQFQHIQHMEDMPLDMSKKKYEMSDENSESRVTTNPNTNPNPNRSEHSKTSPNCLSQLFHQQMMRPSVITCAPKLLNSRIHSTSSKCENCVRGSGDEDRDGSDATNGVIGVNDGNDERITDTNDDNSCFDTIDGNACAQHVCHSVAHIDTGVSDPVIDDHFRRSLGKDYSQIFSNSANTASITVDDHFAKALGETWIRLQKNIQT